MPNPRPVPTERPDRRWIAAGVSVAVHTAVLIGLVTWRDTTPTMPEPPATIVTLVREPRPSPPAQPAKAAAKPAPARPTPIATSAKAPALMAAAGPGDVMSGAALGSATAADTLPGGACGMAHRLQAALRRDALVRAAVASRGLTGASAILVWDGGWVASPGEDGKGLAAVREALVWEVAFAPPACRAEHVHGPVLFSVSDGESLTRIAVGSSDWRWGDLVSSH